MKQQNLTAQEGFEKLGRKSRRELFLDEPERAVPWAALEFLIDLRYPTAGKGRKAGGLADHAANVLRAAVA